MNSMLCIKRKIKLSKVLAVACVTLTFINCLQLWTQYILLLDHSEADSRPHIVLGILSANEQSARRTAVRNTWISTIFQMKEQLPFRITYKFLLDNPTKSLLKENSINNDIVFLNITHHGYCFKFGEKLHIWYKYISNYYPDAVLGARIDDDVFLCASEMLNRLKEIMSPTLYYGWKFGNPHSKEFNEYEFIDEMFVVLGRDLIKRIADRKYCGYRTCPNKNDLVEKQYGSTSIPVWLSIYEDVIMIVDNHRIVHFGNKEGEFERHEKLITGNFCKKYFLFHKAEPDTMVKMHHLVNGQLKFPEKNDEKEWNRGPPVGALTGNIFTGNVVRTIDSTPEQTVYNLVGSESKGLNCINWAVLTTVYPPSQSVVNIASQSLWCLVIVADLKTPDESDYLQNFPDKIRVKYLTLKEQNELYPLLSKSIPLNSLGRKNIGYMYAIHHKAKRIWDFDDDNDGIVNLHDFGMKFNASAFVEPCKGFKNVLVNPYPYFGTNESRTWPRGFPLQNIKDMNTIPKLCKVKEKINIGIIQSLANKQPDVDAIYRLTREVPFHFSATTKSHKGFVIPKDTYTPFNAQATLWLSSAFEYMALPVSVSGRITDIWRSYIAEYFLHRNNLRLIFVPPYVIQERNEHTIIRDLNAEADLYEKSRQLVDFLSKLNNRTTLTEVYEDLYTRNYIQISDLKFIRAWELTLTAVKS